MAARKNIAIVMAGLVALFLLYWFFCPAARRTEKSPPAAAPAPAVPAPRDEVPPAAPPAPVEAVLAPESAPAPSVAPDEAVPVRADAILATVNGVAILGRDLMVFGRAAPPVLNVEPEAFEALLQAAIDRELVVQAARAADARILPEQQGQLDQVRKTVMAREGGDPGARYMNVQGTLEEQAAFEVRAAEAMLLRNSLMAQRGHALPYVTEEQVRTHYEANVEKYGALPEDPAARAEAWQKIDYQVRTELAPALQAEYQAQVDALMTSLRSRAQVTRSPAP